MPHGSWRRGAGPALVLGGAPPGPGRVPAAMSPEPRTIFQQQSLNLEMILAREPRTAIFAISKS